MTQLTVDFTDRWPSIAHVPNSPFRAAVAQWLLARIATRVPVTMRMPDGSRKGPRHNGLPVFEIERDDLFHRLGADLKIGLGESYMAGDWHPGAGFDLAEVLTPYAARLTDLVPAWMRTFRRLVEPLHPHHEENHLEGAKSNISRHYDLSNDLFAAFLDETMTYSAAWFEGDQEQVGFDGLAAAQRRKIDGVLDFAHVRPGAHVLEIGTGWGQLALQAAQRGATVHTITLSREQQALAQARIDAAGLTDRVHIELRDYRDVRGEYDAVVSVEMIEAVGAKYWPTYFETVGSLLKPGGYFGLQSITMPNDRMRAARHAYTWIHKYVFPGGLIPSVEAISENARSFGRMGIVDSRSLGLDYARTLRLWRERFDAQRELVAILGFDETFVRLWDFYLAYSEAGFRCGHLNAWQFSMRRMP
jgi:cyclopropane-fatty-acyl-phospholipid synthase